ncbi:unnamed protein product [Penicillium bialowiezense]
MSSNRDPPVLAPKYCTLTNPATSDEISYLLPQLNESIMMYHGKFTEIARLIAAGHRLEILGILMSFAGKYNPFAAAWDLMKWSQSFVAPQMGECHTVADPDPVYMTAFENYALFMERLWPNRNFTAHHAAWLYYEGSRPLMALVTAVEKLEHYERYLDTKDAAVNKLESLRLLVFASREFLVSHQRSNHPGPQPCFNDLWLTARDEAQSYNDPGPQPSLSAAEQAQLDEIRQWQGPLEARIDTLERLLYY